MKALDFKRNIKILISLVYYAALAVSGYLRRLTGRPSTRRLTILYYHGISPEQRLSFARQMNTLRRNAGILPASYRGELPSGKKPVAITFDDAFMSVAEIAVPELAKHLFHSTIFVPVDWIGRTPGWLMEESEFTPTTGGNPRLTEVVMSIEQLKSLSTSLVTLGSHSLTHPSMLDLDTKSARSEIEGSRHRLAELTGREVLEFSFPYGAHDASTVAMCRSAGYATVYSIESRDVDTSSSELVRGRTKVDPSDGPIEFFLKFNGAYQWMGYTGSLKRTLRLMLNKRSQSIRVQTR
jgi:peptidoglycan/xylan/chitin deacetylase (PgdA/CDA1 family)